MRVITLEIGGEPVTVMVETEQSQDECGSPADRSVYVVTWNDLQIDETPTGPTAAARRGRWPRPPATWGTSGSR
jgi:hypothetical protein